MRWQVVLIPGKGPEALGHLSVEIDFADPARGPSARVAVAQRKSARELMGAIAAALASAPAELTT